MLNIKVIDQGFFQHHSDSVDPSNGGDTLGAGKVGNSFPEASLATSPYAIWMSLWTSMDYGRHFGSTGVQLVFNWCSTEVCTAMAARPSLCLRTNVGHLADLLS